MLETLTIRCPRCHRPTEIAVSRGEAEGGISTTSCRQCRAPFVAMTQADGRVLLFDGASLGADPGAGPQLLGIIEPPAGKSGYRVEPPDYLGIFDRGFPPPAPEPGASDDELDRVLTVSRALRRPDGSLRPPAEVAKRIGWRAVWVAQLNEAIQERLFAPPPLSFPPSIFVSYRWGSEADNEWVARLARTLKARGYPVVFDRDEPGEIDVPDLVSKVADARWFVAILDDGYAERIARGDDEKGRIRDGWVFDEYNTAARFSNARQLRIVGFLRGGSELPRGFRHPAPGIPGNVIDVRDPERLELVLDDLFPAIDDAPDARTVERATASLASSHAHLCAGEFEAAYADAEALTDALPGIVDGPAQKVRVALRANWGDVGLSAAEEAMALAPKSRELLRAAALFADAAGEPARAVQYASRYLEQYGDEGSGELAQVRQVLGSALDDVGQVYPAIAHLERVRRQAPGEPGVLNTLGFVYRRAGEPATAIERFEEGLRVDASDPALLMNLTAALLEAGRATDARVVLARLEAALPGHPSVAGLAGEIARAERGTGRGAPPRLVATVFSDAADRWVGCTACPARVPIAQRETLCARCGGVTPMHPASPCPHCTGTGRAVLVPGLAQQCPYCGEGSLTISDGERLA